jgi:hypothetical protein
MPAVTQIAASAASSTASRPPSPAATAYAATGRPTDSVRLHAAVRSSRMGRPHQPRSPAPKRAARSTANPRPAASTCGGTACPLSSACGLGTNREGGC